LALNFLARVLRVELRGEVTVSVVLPGSISTPMWSKSTTHIISLLHQAQHQSTRASDASLTPTTVEYYTKLLLQYASINRIAQAVASPPSAVSDIVCKALGAWFPKGRYLVGYDAYLLDFLARITPEWLWDWIVPVLFAAVL
jgi:NAD(P)-dependent dehydrogenase (short-subunit alcohol dehydrogenase family)